MNNSNNELLEQGIQEVNKIKNKITLLSEQENLFKRANDALTPMLIQLKALDEQLQKLNCRREVVKWRTLWIALGSVLLLNLASLIIIIYKFR